MTDVLLAGGPVAPRTYSSLQAPITKFPAVPRLIAIGDLHGDIHKARRALKLAGLINDRGSWTGGTTTLVQVGDILDRGDQELELFYFLERLQKEAASYGGAVHILNGNHETMNNAGNYRYATSGGISKFGQWAKMRALESALKHSCGCGNGESLPQKWLHLSRDPHRARTAALSPGGDVTMRFMAPHPTVLQVGSTIFVHGGALPHHVEYGFERINRETHEWMKTSSGQSNGNSKPEFLQGRQAIVWARDYSNEDGEKCDCEALIKALDGVPGAKRMVVGHTIQEEGINSACNAKVIRIDVGLSAGCGDGQPEVLEIVHDGAKVSRLREELESNKRDVAS